MKTAKKGKPMELVLATGNPHKVEEIRDILGNVPVVVVPLSSFGNVPEVVEDGATLEENAVKKATEVALRLKRWTLADDTGLEVSALGGEPGVYSARWAGPGCSYADNNRKLLASLKGVPEEKRGARFRCVIAVSDPRGRVATVEGRVRGVIGTRMKGRGGFGYDPLFVVPEYGGSFSELGADVKNSISHRARALRKAKRLLRRIAGGDVSALSDPTPGTRARTSGNR